MRKVTYILDDIEYFRRDFKTQCGLSDAETEKFVSQFENTFSLIYTLYGRQGAGKNEFPDRYQLTDKDGNKVDLNSLNPYQKSCLNRCMDHFANLCPPDESIPPCVIEIKEEEVEPA